MIKDEYENDRGNKVVHSFHLNRDRYHYDFGECSGEEWQQYDTDQDAWYFGVWVNIKERIVVTYTEGDEYRVTCKDGEGLKAELKALADFHGDPPPAFVAIDCDKGTVTRYYQERPFVE